MVVVVVMKTRPLQAEFGEFDVFSCTTTTTTRGYIRDRQTGNGQKWPGRSEKEWMHLSS